MEDIFHLIKLTNSKFIFIPLFFSILFGTIIVSNMWLSSEFSGTVIDASGKPVENAVVLATWEVRAQISGSKKPFIFIESAVDVNGNFRIPRWGPRLSPSLFSSMESGEPTLWVAARGFMPISVVSTDPVHGLSTRFFDASPKASTYQLEIEKLKAHSDSREKEALASFTSRIRGISFGSKVCMWKNARRFEREMSMIEESVAVAENRFFNHESCT